MNWLSKQVLVRRLRPIFIDLNQKSIELGLLQGKVSLRSLRISPAYIDSLLLPFSLVEGTIGELQLRVPLHSPSNVAITVRNLDLLLCRNDQYGKCLARERQLLLAQFAKCFSQSVLEDDQETQEQSFIGNYFRHLVDKVVANFELKAESLRFRVQLAGGKELELRLAQTELGKEVSGRKNWALGGLGLSVFGYQVMRGVQIAGEIGLMDGGLHLTARLGEIILLLKQGAVGELQSIAQLIGGVRGQQQRRPAERPGKGSGRVVVVGGGSLKESVARWWWYAYEQVVHLVRGRYKSNPLMDPAYRRYFYCYSYMVLHNPRKPLPRYYQSFIDSYEHPKSARDIIRSRLNILKLLHKHKQNKHIFQRSFLARLFPRKSTLSPDQEETLIFFRIMRYIGFSLHRMAPAGEKRCLLSESDFINQFELDYLSLERLFCPQGSSAGAWVELQFERIEVLVEDSLILDEFSNLHLQTSIFRKDLPPGTKEEVVYHLRQNFKAKILNSFKSFQNEDLELKSWDRASLRALNLFCSLELLGLSVSQHPEEQLFSLKSLQLVDLSSKTVNPSVIKLGATQLLLAQIHGKDERTLKQARLEVGNVNILVSAPFLEKLNLLTNILLVRDFKRTKPHEQDIVVRQAIDSLQFDFEGEGTLLEAKVEVRKINVVVPLNYEQRGEALALQVADLAVSSGGGQLVLGMEYAKVSSVEDGHWAELDNYFTQTEMLIRGQGQRRPWEEVIYLEIPGLTLSSSVQDTTHRFGPPSGGGLAERLSCRFFRFRQRRSKVLLPFLSLTLSTPDLLQLSFTSKLLGVLFSSHWIEEVFGKQLSPQPPTDQYRNLLESEIAGYLRQHFSQQLELKLEGISVRFLPDRTDFSSPPLFSLYAKEVLMLSESFVLRSVKQLSVASLVVQNCGLKGSLDKDLLLQFARQMLSRTDLLQRKGRQLVQLHQKRRLPSPNPAPQQVVFRKSLKEVFRGCESTKEGEPKLVVSFPRRGEQKCLRAEFASQYKAEAREVSHKVHAEPVTVVYHEQFFRNILALLACAGEYSRVRFEHLCEYLQDQGIWPDIDVLQQPALALPLVPTAEAELASLLLLVFVGSQVYYTIHLQPLRVKTKAESLCKRMLLTVPRLQMKDASQKAGPNSSLLEPGPEAREQLHVEVKWLQSGGQEVNVTLADSTIGFLKKKVKQLVNFLTQHLLLLAEPQLQPGQLRILQVDYDQLNAAISAFLPLLKASVKPSQTSAAPSSFHYNLCMKDCLVLLHRNSVEQAALRLQLSRVQLFNSGRQGYLFNQIFLEEEEYSQAEEFSARGAGDDEEEEGLFVRVVGGRLRSQQGVELLEFPLLEVKMAGTPTCITVTAPEPLNFCLCPADYVELMRVLTEGMGEVPETFPDLAVPDYRDTAPALGLTFLASLAFRLHSATPPAQPLALVSLEQFATKYTQLNSGLKLIDIVVQSFAISQLTEEASDYVDPVLVRSIKKDRSFRDYKSRADSTNPPEWHQATPRKGASEQTRALLNQLLEEVKKQDSASLVLSQEFNKMATKQEDSPSQRLLCEELPIDSAVTQSRILGQWPEVPWVIESVASVQPARLGSKPPARQGCLSLSVQMSYDSEKLTEVSVRDIELNYRPGAIWSLLDFVMSPFKVAPNPLFQRSAFNNFMPNVTRAEGSKVRVLFSNPKDPSPGRPTLVASLGFSYFLSFLGESVNGPGIRENLISADIQSLVMHFEEENKQFEQPFLKEKCSFVLSSKGVVEPASREQPRSRTKWSRDIRFAGGPGGVALSLSFGSLRAVGKLQEGMQSKSLENVAEASWPCDKQQLKVESISVDPIKVELIKKQDNPLLTLSLKEFEHCKVALRSKARSPNSECRVQRSKASLLFDIYFYNRKLDVFEPLLEPLAVSARTEEVLEKQKKSAGGRTLRHRVCLEVEPPSGVRVNFSIPALETVGLAFQFLRRPSGEQGRVVHNLSGYPDDLFQYQDTQLNVMFQPICKQQVRSLYPILLPPKMVGKRLFRVERKTLRDRLLPLREAELVAVHSRINTQLRKQILISTNYKIINNSQRTLHLVFSRDGRALSLLPVPDRREAQFGFVPLPFEFLLDEHVQVSISPPESQEQPRLGLGETTLLLHQLFKSDMGEDFVQDRSQHLLQILGPNCDESNKKILRQGAVNHLRCGGRENQYVAACAVGLECLLGDKEIGFQHYLVLDNGLQVSNQLPFELQVEDGDNHWLGPGQLLPLNNNLRLALPEIGLRVFLPGSLSRDQLHPFRAVETKKLMLSLENLDSDDELAVQAEVVEPFPGKRKVEFFAQYICCNRTSLPLVFREKGCEYEVRLPPGAQDVCLSFKKTKLLFEVMLQGSSWEWSQKLAVQQIPLDFSVYRPIGQSERNRTRRCCCGESQVPPGCEVTQLSATLQSSTKYPRSKIVAINYKYFLLNESQLQLGYRQHSPDAPRRFSPLPPSERLPLVWACSDQEQLLQFGAKVQGRFLEGDQLLSLAMLTDSALHLPKRTERSSREDSKLGDDTLFVPVKTRLANNIFTIRIFKPDVTRPPVRLVNRTKFELLVKEKGQRRGFMSLGAGEEQGFAWFDLDPDHPRVLLVEVEKVKVEIDTSAGNQIPPIPIGQKKNSPRRLIPYRKAKLSARIGPHQLVLALVVLKAFKQRLELRFAGQDPRLVELRGCRLQEKGACHLAVVSPGKDDVQLVFSGEDQYQEWFLGLQQSIEMNLPEVVVVEVKPVGESLCILFKSAHLDRGAELRKASSFELRLSLFGLSLIDEGPRELLYLQLDELRARRTLQYHSQAGDRLTQDGFRLVEFNELTVDSIKINDCLKESLFPVVLAHSRRKLGGEKFARLDLVVEKQAFTLEENPSAKGSLSVKLFRLRLDQCELVISTALLETLYSTIKALFYRDLIGLFRVEAPHSAPEEHDDLKLFISNLQIVPCPRILLSIHLANSSESNPFLTLLPAVEDLSILPQPFQRVNIYVTAKELVERLSSFFYNDIKYQWLKVIGSIGIVRAPVGMVTGLGSGVLKASTGVYQLVSGQGNEGLSEFRSGFSRLLDSLFSILMIFTFFFDFLAFLTLDEAFYWEREAFQKQRIKNFRMGLSLGAKRFCTTMLDGLTGPVTKPLAYARKSRFKILGFLQGLVVGVFSLLKVVIAIFDLVRCVAIGIKNQAIYEENITERRSRPPRVFAQDIYLECYDYSKALFRELQGRHGLEECPGEDVRLCYSPGEGEAVYVLTNIRALSTSRSGDGCDTLKLHRVQVVQFIRQQLTLISDFPEWTCLGRRKLFRWALQPQVAAVFGRELWALSHQLKFDMAFLWHGREVLQPNDIQ